MMRPIIEADHLAKCYRLGAAGGYLSLREALARVVRSPLRRRAGETFWALDDVHFQITPGEAVGIIGRNGAGKSTLLKILSRITAPTRGEVRLRGRIAALLEVGTGFHPELTGRENIFLNGAIMGMRRAEIRRVFDEIVAFADIEKFLDTPVKRYSSGMYVRLAFAVAAHLQPEILVVDEVLAVGDAAFQKKCLGKMQDVASGGRTVLFVSHNMAAITRLCHRAILLNRGKVVADGPVSSVVSTYLGGSLGESPTQIDFARRGKLPGNDQVRLLAARISTEGGDPASIDIRRPVSIEMEYEVLSDRQPINPNIHVYNEEGQCVFATTDAYMPEHQKPRAPGKYRSTVEIPGNFFAEGMISVDLAISTMEPAILHVHERGVLSFQIHDPAEGDSMRGTFVGRFPGIVRPRFPWTTVSSEEPST